MPDDSHQGGDFEARLASLMLILAATLARAPDKRLQAVLRKMRRDLDARMLPAFDADAVAAVADAIVDEVVAQVHAIGGGLARH